MQETLVLIKPDAVKRQLSGEIISRYERKGLVIKALKLLQVPRELAEEHYAEHKEKPFIRGDYALTMDANVVHASDSPEAATREIHLWFPEYN
ncbi:MAG: nucleoside-diphosphate kinase [Veillonella sp.]|nr:nucleoside-diphosphate kinase [Veillonella sp.]